MSLRHLQLSASSLRGDERSDFTLMASLSSNVKDYGCVLKTLESLVDFGVVNDVSLVILGRHQKEALNKFLLTADAIGNLKIKVVNDATAKEFYRTVWNSKFLLSGIPDKSRSHALLPLDIDSSCPVSDEYYERRATATVPAALMTGTPVILQKQLLELYPCLRDAPMHRLVAKDSIYESIRSAYFLNSDEYDAMRIEVLQCYEELQLKAKAILLAIATSNQTDSSAIMS